MGCGGGGETSLGHFLGLWTEQMAVPITKTGNIGGGPV